MSQLQSQNTIKQEAIEQSTSSFDTASSAKTSRIEFEDNLMQNLDFAESLKLLAQNGKFSSNKISVKTKFDKKATDILKSWLIKNIDNPYPSDEVKDKLCEMTGLNKKQVQNWFTNTRKRYVQPLKRKIRNDMLSDEHFSSESGESQEDTQSTVKSEEIISKPQALPEVQITTTLAPQFTSAIVPNVYQVSQAVSAPLIILPGQYVLPGAERLGNPAFANIAHQSLQIPQFSYRDSLAPQSFLIDRNLLNFDQNSFIEQQKEAESREKLMRTIMINDSLKVALQVMRQEKLKGSGEMMPGCVDESVEAQIRNKQRRQDLEAYLHQITKKVHVA